MDAFWLIVFVGVCVCEAWRIAAVEVHPSGFFSPYKKYEARGAGLQLVTCVPRHMFLSFAQNCDSYVVLGIWVGRIVHRILWTPHTVLGQHPSRQNLGGNLIRIWMVS